jgi:glycyl-tRNA synthetase
VTPEKQERPADGASKLDRITDLALRRGFYFPAAEFYPGVPAGFWDYGPLGAALKRAVIDRWRAEVVRADGMLEVDGATVLPTAVFDASGHRQSFADPVTRCPKCLSIHRADRLVQEKAGIAVPEALPPKEIDGLIAKYGVRCPKCGSALGPVERFGMMFEFSVGPARESTVALRPETCQNIFLDFPRLFKTMGIRLPIGVAQVGRSFRNEISPRQGLYRLREFTQAEVEVFFNPNRVDAFSKPGGSAETRLVFQKVGEVAASEVSATEALERGFAPNRLVAHYLALIYRFFEGLGIPRAKLRLRELDDKERPFYAASAWDLEVLTSFGWVEVVANHHRADHDLSVHAKGSGADLSVLDGGERITPWVWEASMGIDRTVLILLDAAYHEQDKRIQLRLPRALAPVQVSVFPLVAKDGLPEKAAEVLARLVPRFTVTFDERDSIGKRYVRSDEIGVPFAVTIDYDSLKDGAVTVRERDTRAQERVPIEGLVDWLLRQGLTGPG